MRALILSNGELAEREIENTLEELQNLVEGHIELPYLSERFRRNGINIVINADGRFINRLRPEIAIVGVGNLVVDFVYGTCIFVSHNQYGETVELNKKQKKIVMEELNDRAILYDPNRMEKYLVKILNIY